LREVRLAKNWPRSRVLTCLGNSDKCELGRYLKERYEDRFLKPIELLRSAPHNEVGYGFALMALCCLLIETIESYRKGWPSSYGRELKNLAKRPENKTSPPQYKLNPPFGGIDSKTAFVDFFTEPDHQQFFPSVNGEVFYTEIRCGLLHQAQTKGSWRITRGGAFWDNSQKTINRNEFAIRTRECFEDYVKELSQAVWNGSIWINARKKIWWTAQVA